MTSQLRLSIGTVDLATGSLERDGRSTPLVGKELALLRYFTRNTERVVTREELYTEVWGYSPQVQSRTLDVTLHKLRAKIEGDPSSPVHLRTVVGEGYQFVPLPEPVGRPASQMFGRTEEMEWLCRRLASERLVSIVGPGGIGKTRLMMEAASETDLQVVSVDLSGQDDIALARAQVGLELGDPELGWMAAQGVGEIWLFLDNVEQLLPGWAAEIADALARVPSLRILVTSRRPLGLSSEALIPLGPLDPASASALFADRARRRNPAFQAEERLVAEVVKVLDYWPLALELAAARTRIYPLSDLLIRMQTDLANLGVSESDRPERHRSLRGALEWSWKLLLEPEREALAGLAAFPDGFSIDAAEVVLGPDAAERVLALIDHSWCFRTDDGRFRMLAPAREFASIYTTDVQKESVRTWFARLIPSDVVERLHRGEGFQERWRRESLGLEFALTSREPAIRAAAAVALIFAGSGRVAPDTPAFLSVEREVPSEWRLPLAVAMGESSAGFSGRRVIAVGAGLQGEQRALVLLAAIPNASLAEAPDLEGWLAEARPHVGQSSLLLAYERLAIGVIRVRQGRLLEALEAIGEAERLARQGGWIRLLESRAGQRLRIQWGNAQEALDEPEPIPTLLSLQWLARSVNDGFEGAIAWRERHLDRQGLGGIGDAWGRAMGAILADHPEQLRMALDQWPPARRTTAIYQLLTLASLVAQKPAVVRAELETLAPLLRNQPNDWVRVTGLCVERLVRRRLGEKPDVVSLEAALTRMTSDRRSLAWRLLDACR